MATQPTSQDLRPAIVKYVQPQRSGIRSQTFARHAIGYVLRGEKHIYNGDALLRVNRGEMFYMGIGHHYTEEIPEGGKPFEQIILYYTSEEFAQILSTLNLTYRLSIADDHSCEKCRNDNHVVCETWSTARNFFLTANQYLREDIFASDPIAARIKMTELVYMLVTRPDCCIKSKILGGIDSLRENFESVVRSHIFSDISIERLAEKCNRSMTAFKMEFRRHFAEPPHRWFIRQRLMHSRLLLISTHKSVSEIGNECNFPNTSHFIKLFKKEYGHTPSSYRQRNTAGHRPTAEMVETWQPATA